MSLSPSLESLQKWMHAVITNPHGIQSGMESDEAQSHVGLHPDQLDTLVLPSSACTSHERLNVYGNAYFARLIECLSAEFPALHHVLGEETFAGFAVGYLQAFPPSSHTLADLGSHFAEYLRLSRPPREDSDDRTPDWPEFLIDLATVERIYSEVFDGPGEEQTPLLTADQLQAISPEQWASLVLDTSASLKLVHLQYPVHEYITAVRHQSSPVILSANPTWLAIHRKNYVVRRSPISELQFVLLSALQRGETLEASLERISEFTHSDENEIALSLGNWFRDWTAAGYFRSVRINPVVE